MLFRSDEAARVFLFGFAVKFQAVLMAAMRTGDFIAQDDIGGAHPFVDLATPQALGRAAGDDLGEDRAFDALFGQVERAALAFPDTPEGKQAMKESLDRIAAARASGEAPDDMECSLETAKRQNVARGKLWRADESNYRDLARIKLPVLVADGRVDIIDPPQN